MGFFNNFKLGSALSMLKRTFNNIHETVVESVKGRNELLRIYYDSSLGSPVESVVEEAFASTTYSVLKNHTPDWKIADRFCRFVGKSIGRIQTWALDKSKLVYQSSKDIISADQAYQEGAKRLASVVFVAGKALNKFGPLAGAAAHAVVEFFSPGMGDNVRDIVERCVTVVTKGVVDKVFTEKNKDRLTKFIAKGSKVAVTGFKKVVDKIDTAVDKARPAIQKAKKFVGNCAEKVGMAVNDFCTGVKNAVSTIADKTSTGIRKVGKFLGGLFRR